MYQSFTRLIFFSLGIVSVRASEYCLDGFYFCEDYCCGVKTCCSSCSMSINLHPSCALGLPIKAIIPIVVVIIVILIIFSVFYAICRGCISVDRRRFSGRGRMFNPRHSECGFNLSGYPEGQLIYPESPNVYPQGPNVYPQAPNVYPQGPNVYPQAPNVYSQDPNVYPQAPNVYPQAPNVYPQTSGHYVPQTDPQLGPPPPYQVTEQGYSHENKQDLVQGLT